MRAPKFLSKGEVIAPQTERHQSVVEDGPLLVETPKSFIQRITPVFACGSGLFSDGYINGVSGAVNLILQTRYGAAYSASGAAQNFGSIQFVGIVVGQLFFGFTSDRFSRKWSLLVSTVMLFVFNALTAGAYGAGGSVSGLFSALAAWRFLTGIAIGGEYPAGSVSCAESTGELKSGSRNRWFIWFTNATIDVGFVAATTVAMIVAWITGHNLAPSDVPFGHLDTAWRVIIGIGCVAPLSLLWARWKLEEPEAFKRESTSKAGFSTGFIISLYWSRLLVWTRLRKQMPAALQRGESYHLSKTPTFLGFRLYWFRLLIVAAVWFSYDFLAYGFSFYATTITNVVLQDTAPLWRVFGWGTLINFFYVPGAFLGAWLSDVIGAKTTLVLGVSLQAVVGFLMAGIYAILSRPENIAGFAVVYGVFLSFGEMGPGDNIGLFAAKSCATPIRGQFYGIAAATGKIGAYVAIWVFPVIENDGGGSKTVKGNQDLFWVAASMAVFTAVLALLFLPEIGQDTIDHEDRRFRAYLMENGYDVSNLGLDHTTASMSSRDDAAEETKFYPSKEQ